MPPSGRRLAQERAFSWIDLSGNASIRTPRVFIHVEGKPNQFVRRGRPSTPFAPKSSRIARWLLMNPEREANQAALAAATRLHPATVSRVLRRLVDDGLVRRDGRRYSVRDAGLLLDAWRSEYDFERHEVRAGYLPARTGQAALADLVAAFDATMSSTPPRDWRPPGRSPSSPPSGSAPCIFHGAYPPTSCTGLASSRASAARTCGCSRPRTPASWTALAWLAGCGSCTRSRSILTWAVTRSGRRRPLARSGA